MAASALLAQGAPASRTLEAGPAAVPEIDQRVSDEDLLRSCGLGDHRALDELAGRYQRTLYRLLLRLTGRHEDAEDALVEVFVRVWRAAPRFQFRARVSTWLYRIAYNIARDLYDHKRIRPREMPLADLDENRLTECGADEEVLSSACRAENAKRLQMALGCLPASDRMALTLYYFEDKSFDEIQEVFGVSRCAVKTRLARARARLRNEMERVSEDWHD